MDKSQRCVKGLGEVSICVKDLDGMQKFYEEVVGLEVLSREDGYVFFRIADGYGGHSQNLALFRADNTGFLRAKSMELNLAGSTLHHVAFNVALDDFHSERQRLERLGSWWRQPSMNGRMCARSTSPIQRATCWSSSLEMTVSSRQRLGIPRVGPTLSLPNCQQTQMAHRHSGRSSSLEIQLG